MFAKSTSACDAQKVISISRYTPTDETQPHPILSRISGPRIAVLRLATSRWWRWTAEAAGPEAIGFAVAISTVTGIFFKMPAGVLSDVIGRTRTLFMGLAVFAVVPFAYLLVSSFEALVVVRFFHGFATAIYGPVAMAVVVSVVGDKRAEMLSWFSSVTIIGNLIGAPLGGLLLTQLSGAGAPHLRH